MAGIASLMPKKESPRDNRAGGEVVLYFMIVSIPVSMNMNAQTICHSPKTRVQKMVDRAEIF